MKMADSNLVDPGTQARAADGNTLSLLEARTAMTSARVVRGATCGRVPDSAGRAARRALDVVLATVLVVCLIPLLLVIAALIKLDSAGPVLFRQRRLGKDRRPFTVLKFRTMRADATPALHMKYVAKLADSEDAGTGLTLKKLTDDPRVTRVGRPLRRLSLDELPQLFNVLAGQMALVGPRPAIEYELAHYEPSHFERFRVRPGITGLWQVSGRSALGFKDMLDLDAEYAIRPSFATDVRILAKTPAAAVKNAA